jgi:hypothetical protein
MAASPCRWALIAHSLVLPPHFLTMGRQRSKRSAAFLATLGALQRTARIRRRAVPLARRTAPMAILVASRRMSGARR